MAINSINLIIREMKTEDVRECIQSKVSGQVIGDICKITNCSVGLATETLSNYFKKLIQSGMGYVIEYGEVIVGLFEISSYTQQNSAEIEIILLYDDLPTKELMIETCLRIKRQAPKWTYDCIKLIETQAGKKVPIFTIYDRAWEA